MNWPLQVDPFTYWDRFKICSYIFNKKNRLTMGPQTHKLEKTVSEYSKTRCIATSSGSTANHLLVETVFQTNNLNPCDVTVFCPAVTWSSSITPWIMRGCDIKFIDVNLDDFSFSYGKLEEAVKECQSKVKILWPTNLIGNIANFGVLKCIAKKYNCFLFADSCEATIGDYEGKQVLSCASMSTSSFYLAHQICGVELGVLCIKDEKYYNNALMIRSHGLVRNLKNISSDYNRLISENKHLDPEFLFQVGGTNYRPSDVHSTFALQDFKRIQKYERERSNIWEYYLNGLDDKFLPLNRNIVPFCLPVIKNNMEESNLNIPKLKQDCINNGIEVRGIIGGNLAIQPYFKQFVLSGEIFPNAQWINDNGFYVGLHNKVNKGMIDKLLKILNK